MTVIFLPKLGRERLVAVALGPVSHDSQLVEIPHYAKT